MKRFTAHRVEQRVVVDIDHLGRLVAAIDDAGNLANATQAAARTRTLQNACGRDNFNFHGVSPLCARFRDQNRARVYRMTKQLYLSGVNTCRLARQEKRLAISRLSYKVTRPSR